MTTPTQPKKTSALTRALKLDYSSTTEPMVHSQRALRRLIGILGILLPLLIWLVVLTDTGHLPPLDSISHYYFTRANSLFISVITLLAIFLLIYKGHEPIDFYVSFLAGLGAILLVLFPTNNITKACNEELAWSITFLRDSDYTTFRIGFHYACAGVFLLSLAYMSIFLFTRPSGPQNKEKKNVRNRIYIGCGIAMIIALILIALGFLKIGIPTKIYNGYHLTFWLETLAVVSFGTSWLIKGETLFRGKKSPQS